MTEHLHTLAKALGREVPEGLSEDEQVELVEEMQREWMDRNG